MEQFLFVSDLTISMAINAQNIGVGETSPASKFTAGQAAFSGDAVSKIRWMAIGN